MGHSSRDRRLERRQIALIVGLAFVLLALVYVLFLRSGPADDSQDRSPSGPPLAQAETEDPFEPQPEDDQISQPVETFEVFASRDPFEPVVGDAPEDGGSGDSKDDGAGGDDGGDDERDPSGEIGSDAPGSDSNQDTVKGRSVSLIDVFRAGGKGKAQVQVDSTGYTVTAGEVFAENFQLVTTSGSCATLLYGDDQFTLCEGEQILK